MDQVKRRMLIERIKTSNESNLPLVTVEEFFEGNDDWGSIGCNLSPMLGPSFFYEHLKSARLRANVQAVLVGINEVDESDPTVWPFSDRIYIFANATLDEVRKWTAALRPDDVQEGLITGLPKGAPELKPGFKTYLLWWD
jgi:hypothetical protein